MLELADMPGWADDDHLAAFAAFRMSARRMVDAAPKTRALGPDGEALARAGRAALDEAVETADDARRFFERYFVAKPVPGSGMLTGFFEPVVEAAREKGGRFVHPLYARPDWLVDVKDAPDGWDAQMRYGRQTETGLLEAPDRAAVMDGALAGEGLELAWLACEVDAFFIHIQGATRLAMTDGTTMRVTYDGKSGHDYTSLGKLVCEERDIDPADMTADRLADILRTEPDTRDRLLRQNRSFIFFREADGASDDTLGQVAAAKVQLTPGRSLAVDRTQHTFHAPVFITSLQPLPGGDAPLARLVVMQDTGSAITGEVRGDLFTGSGEAAGELAGRIRQPFEMAVLHPRDAS